MVKNTHDAGGTATNKKAFGAPGGFKATSSPYVAKEPSATISVTQYSVARVTTAQRLETMLAHRRATKGESTQIAKRTIKIREGLR